MIYSWGNNFGNRTTWSLLYFLIYVYLNISACRKFSFAHLGESAVTNGLAVYTIYKHLQRVLTYRRTESLHIWKNNGGEYVLHIDR